MECIPAIPAAAAAAATASDYVVPPVRRTDIAGAALKRGFAVPDDPPEPMAALVGRLGSVH